MWRTYIEPLKKPTKQTKTKTYYKHDNAFLDQIASEDLINLVLMKHFICTVRTSDWKLDIYCVKEMIPNFYAAWH